MSTEPTLEQWRERALVAEALLEDRTQEAEGLKAQLDQMKIERDAKNAKADLSAGKYVAKTARPYPRWDEKLEGYQRQMMASIQEEMLRAATRRDMKARPPRITDGEFLAEYAPQTRFKVDVHENPDDGALRIIVVLQGSAPQGFQIERRKYLSLLDSPGGVINVANHAGKAIAEKLFLNSRDTSELCQRISDAIGAMRRRR